MVKEWREARKLAEPLAALKTSGYVEKIQPGARSEEREQREQATRKRQ